MEPGIRATFWWFLISPGRRNTPASNITSATRQQAVPVSHHNKLVPQHKPHILLYPRNYSGLTQQSCTAAGTIIAHTADGYQLCRCARRAMSRKRKEAIQGPPSITKTCSWDIGCNSVLPEHRRKKSGRKSVKCRSGIPPLQRLELQVPGAWDSATPQEPANPRTRTPLSSVILSHTGRQETPNSPMCSNSSDVSVRIT